MRNFYVKTKIRLNGKLREFIGTSSKYFEVRVDSSDDYARAYIKPIYPLELIEFALVYDYQFNDKDRFFSAGYQSWTTAMEYTADSIQRGISHLAKGKLKSIAKISSDEYIVGDYPEKKGCFHSITYSYIRNASDLMLIGSLNERTGYTVIKCDMNCNTLSVGKDLQGKFLSDEEYECLNVVFYSGTYDEVFDKYFDKLGCKKPKIEHMAGYTSWYNYFKKIDENIILRDLDGLDRAKDVTTIFQVDDGYETYVGDWLDKSKKFPNGMKHIADKIHEKGYLAGIWLAPFLVQIASRTYKEHPEWILRDEKGKPVLGCASWGGAYTLDIYIPGVKEHIKSFFDVVLNDWGYDMVKLDFLYAECHTSRYGKTKGEIMCDAVDFLRECCGDKLILGCGLPLGPAFGKVDACRISCDANLVFEGQIFNKIFVNNEVPSAEFAINNTIFRRHLNGRAFCNDPDVFFLRDNNIKYSREQKLLLAKINNMFGDVLFVSDDCSRYDEETLAILKDMFVKKPIKIVSAEYVSKDRIRIIHDFEKTRNCFEFNIKTGDIYYDGAIEILS